MLTLKIDPTIHCLQETHLSNKHTYKLKVKRCKYSQFTESNINQVQFYSYQTKQTLSQSYSKEIKNDQYKLIKRTSFKNLLIYSTSNIKGHIVRDTIKGFSISTLLSSVDIKIYLQKSTKLRFKLFCRSNGFSRLLHYILFNNHEIHILRRPQDFLQNSHP